MRLSSLLVLFLLWNIAITNAIFFTNLEKGSIHPKAPNSNIIKGNTRFHQLSKGNVPSSHFSVNSNNECVVKGYQSIRFHELSKGPIPPEGT